MRGTHRKSPRGLASPVVDAGLVLAISVFAAFLSGARTWTGFNSPDSEFYASLVPTSPNVATLQTNSASRIPACYYGQGRCQ